MTEREAFQKIVESADDIAPRLAGVWRSDGRTYVTNGRCMRWSERSLDLRNCPDPPKKWPLPQESTLWRRLPQPGTTIKAATETCAICNGEPFFLCECKGRKELCCCPYCPGHLCHQCHGAGKLSSSIECNCGGTGLGTRWPACRRLGTIWIQDEFFQICTPRAQHLTQYAVSDDDGKGVALFRWSGGGSAICEFLIAKHPNYQPC